MGEPIRICCVTADLSDDDLDLPKEPGIILRGTLASVKMAAALWGEPVAVETVHNIAHRENLLRRAHDALSRTAETPMLEADWDRLVADIATELGTTA